MEAGDPQAMQTQTQTTANQANGPEAFSVSRVAWQFVVQYYTHMNNKPELLHRFYTKNSHYLYGVEGEETNLHQGQAAIHKKFQQIKFKDCKVFIHSVDAQPSANNGIFVHVIGEMANDDEPWRKFVQAFFLAEQTNGYYVLNDNFRYLKEESFDEEGEDEPRQEQETILPEQNQTAYTNGFHNLPSDSPFRKPAVAPSVTQPLPPSVPAEAPVPPPPVAEPPAEPKPTMPEPPAEPKPTIPEPPAEPKPTMPEPVEQPSPTVPEVVEPEPEPAPPSPPAVPSPPMTRKSPSPAPTTPAPASIELAQPTASTSATTPLPAQQPPVPAAAAPPAPKTWASLAATNSSKWGQNVAQEVKGVSTSVTQPPAAVPTSHARDRPSAASTSGSAGDVALQPGGVRHKNTPPNQQHPNYSAALAVNTPLCFVKGVTENVTQQALEQVLTQRFGPIKECEIVRNKACAFLEFKSIESAKKAILASLHISQGGEGGIKFDEERYGPARIIVETRKERSDRPQPRPRVTTGGENKGNTTPAYIRSGQGSGDQGPGRGRGGGARGRGDGGRGAKI